MKRRLFLGAALAGLLGHQAQARSTAFGKDPMPKWRGKVYSGPKVTHIRVRKKRRQMMLMHNRRVLKKYKINLGFAPKGHKIREGDGKTPEGLYFIDRRNYASKYYLSLGISYPNFNDLRRARDLGVKPGGDIFIHGAPVRGKPSPTWTAGCIAVSNDEMREIFWMVGVGTPIYIDP